MIAYEERWLPLRQITRAAYGHILANRQCWTVDSQWLLYDLRHDETVFDGQRIERVHVLTGEVEVLYQAAPNEFCGVPTCSPVDDRYVFIASPQWTGADDDWPYRAWHRHGLLGRLSTPQQTVILDARDIVAPFTPGALRGGTHLHVFSPNAERIVSTYEDHVLAESNAPLEHDNRRLLAVSYLSRPVQVPKTNRHNHDGHSFTVCVTNAAQTPQPGSHEFLRAHSEAWLGNDSLVFQAEVVRRDGQTHRELFRLQLPEFSDAFLSPHVCGTRGTRPGAAPGVAIERLTFTDHELHPGLDGPRHWVLPSSDQTLIGCLRKDSLGNAQFWIYELPTGRFQARSSFPFSITSCFTWHPTERAVTFVADGSVWLLLCDRQRALRLTKQNDSLAPSHHACVFSPDGTQIAFQSATADTQQHYHQLFVVHGIEDAMQSTH